MMMVGSTCVFTVGELLTLGYVPVGEVRFSPDAKAYAQYWVQMDSRLFAVSFGESTACYTNTETLEQTRRKMNLTAIGVDPEELPVDVKNAVASRNRMIERKYMN